MPRPPRPPRPPAAVAPVPRSLPPLLRDPWAWAALASLGLVLARSLGVPFGEPVADDFDHLHHALFTRDHSWLDGGGSRSFWRPLAYQGYYGLLRDVILAHPAWITALHAALAAATVLLVFAVARRHLSRPAAAVVASFPLLLESARALLIVPVHFVDLGLVFFSALAWWCAERRRLLPALAALLAALLCKETAVATALVLPWLAHPREGRPRRAWLLATGGLTAAWAVTYVLVRRRFAMELPHGLEAHLSPALLLDARRYAWALAGTLRALVSLPLKPEPRDGFVFAALLLVLGLALVRLGTERPARARLAAAGTWTVTLLAWGAIATGTLLTVYPVWSPERVVYASLGLGAAATVVLDAALPGLAWALVALRLVTFALAPAPPARVTRDAPDRGAFVDFERLVRLQRLMHEARTTLRREFPSLPRGAGVAMLHPPFMADYAGGDKALQAWYRDPTLRWVHWEQLGRSDAPPLAGAMEFQEDATPPFRRIEPRALELLLAAGEINHEGRHQGALDTLELAARTQRDPLARHFVGRVEGLRAWCLGSLGRVPEAETAARRSLAISPENADGHLTLAAIYNGRGEWVQSLAQLDTLLGWYPGYEAAVMMRKGVLERMRELGVPQPTGPPRLR